MYFFRILSCLETILKIKKQTYIKIKWKKTKCTLIDTQTVGKHVSKKLDSNSSLIILKDDFQILTKHINMIHEDAIKTLC